LAHNEVERDGADHVHLAVRRPAGDQAEVLEDFLGGLPSPGGAALKI
jgi:hypothetical protein